MYTLSSIYKVCLLKFIKYIYEQEFLQLVLKSQQFILDPYPRNKVSHVIPFTLFFNFSTYHFFGLFMIQFGTLVSIVVVTTLYDDYTWELYHTIFIMKYTNRRRGFVLIVVFLGFNSSQLFYRLVARRVLTVSVFSSLPTL